VGDLGVDSYIPTRLLFIFLEKLFWAIIWVLKKTTPVVGFSGVFVHYSDEISNRQFILDFAKVVDFIEEIEHL